MYLPQPTASNDFELPPAGGPYVAVCTRVIDLGTQFSEFYNKSSHKLMLGWELADMADSQGRPYQIAKRYTLSMHEKAQLRKDLEAWRGAPFVASDFGPGGFEIAKLLGKPCQMMISHSEGGERTYANVSALMKLGKGMVAPEAISPLEYIALNAEEFDRAAFDQLSDGLKRVICESPEGRALGLNAPPQQTQQVSTTRAQQQRQAQSYSAQERAVAPPPQQRFAPGQKHSAVLPQANGHTEDLNDEIPF